MTQTDKPLYEQSQTATGGTFQIMEYAKNPKMRVPNADKGREGATALS
jgi:hypothetical protein